MIKGGTFRRVVYNPREKQRSAVACLRRAWTFPLLFRRVRLLTPLQATAISWWSYPETSGTRVEEMGARRKSKLMEFALKLPFVGISPFARL